VWEFITSKEAIDLVGDCETPEEACRVVSAHAAWVFVLVESKICYEPAAYVSVLEAPGSQCSCHLVACAVYVVAVAVASSGVMQESSQLFSGTSAARR
jgi:hypothetical protein